MDRQLKIGSIYQAGDIIKLLEEDTEISIGHILMDGEHIYHPTLNFLKNLSNTRNIKILAVTEGIGYKIVENMITLLNVEEIKEGKRQIIIEKGDLVDMGIHYIGLNAAANKINAALNNQGLPFKGTVKGNQILIKKNPNHIIRKAEENGATPAL